MNFADFPIVYNGITYMVDPFIFCYKSQRFRDIFHPGYSGFSQVTINGNFQPLSVDLFCSICQNHQVTVPPECVNDIATLARIFVAEPAVTSYIGNVNATPNGNIVFENRKSINQAYDDFDWLNNYDSNENQNANYSFESTYQNQFNDQQISEPIFNPTPAPTFNQEPEQTFNPTPAPTFNQEPEHTFGSTPTPTPTPTPAPAPAEPSTFHQTSEQTINQVPEKPNDQDQHPTQIPDQTQIQQNPNQIPDQSQISETNPNQLPDQSQIPDQYQSYNQPAPSPSDDLADPMPYYTPTPTVYEVQVEKKLIKCNRYSLLQNGQVVATAKTRTGSIVLNIGVDAHFKQMDMSAGEIQRYSFLNIVKTDGKKHDVKFFRDADTGYMTLHVLFYINNDHLLLTGLKKLPKEKIFGTLKVLDESHPCNLYLKNGRTAMTFTQTSKSTFTIESYLKVSMIFTFAMFMCAVTGPHTQFSSDVKE